MKVSREVVNILEDLLFDYERQAALIEVLHTLVSEKSRGSRRSSREHV